MKRIRCPHCRRTFSATGPSLKPWQSAGGKARSAKLSPERRREIAKEAAAIRWARKMFTSESK